MESIMDDNANIFREELKPGERILWTGQPQQGFILRPSDAVLIPFSLLWGGFAIFWEITAVMGGGGLFFSLWGIPFVLVGVYIIAGRFFMDRIQRRKTFYALTTERAMIKSGLFNQNIRTINFKMLPDISFSTGRDNRGTITFGAVDSMAWLYSGGGWPSFSKRPIAPSFERITDARIVYQHIQRLQGEIEITRR